MAFACTISAVVHRYFNVLPKRLRLFKLLGMASVVIESYKVFKVGSLVVN